MATVFKGFESTGITTETVVYTTPVSTTATIVGMTIANTTSNAVTVSVKKNTAYMVKDAPIPVGGALVVVGGDQKVVVNESGTIDVTSDGVVDAIISVMEQV